MSDIHKTLGKNIRNYRKEKNLTSVEFAKHINISTGQLSNVENGNHEVFRLGLLDRITNSLGVSLGELLQTNSIDIRSLYIEEAVKKVLIKEMPNDSSDQIHIINEQLNTLIHSYLATISEYQCDVDKIHSIADHVISQLQFIKNLKVSNSKASAS
ncbi:transcriptional regulator, XRE family [Alkaliphilus metalliredigens QYMF]|uniref:Transcriptional regulator, XRE family n=1 Tax=Alkaliphilus metalliredigens (strain QYMF) TaxID=293826 RepID=A6TQ77_ALKMQ|nr:helix-turn-helix transcriptional regulator [Alkaliphilus metalliredigens]ABR48345.1 transcriptional regulator, XRE family [Alkaliphilus metalliredigens QYMF]